MAPIRHMMDMPGGHMMSEAEMTEMMGSSSGHTSAYLPLYLATTAAGATLLTRRAECIVMFKDGTTPAEIKQHASEIEAQGGVVTEIYDYMLKGFSAVIPEAMITQLQSLTGSGGIIDYIERDSVVSV
ncbi:uncharacterized protein SCHCODRAFT_01100852 [Schizophyllum commune H4-8]|nr:uncharacterized protein SCHCODRAFT_01100852 [Schizophyllum commune H4-8]KAI5889688.1 hypothetical protein SCHCODRAFT_01100852 [Schizophyllum commune H4-8]